MPSNWQLKWGVGERLQIIDVKDGRDYKRGEDSNAVEKQKIIENILKCIPDGISEEIKEQFKTNLKNSRIKDMADSTPKCNRPY
jgi:hypothetical protein